jgi:hypothetical protein
MSSFQCPIFDVSTEVRTCAKLMDMIMSGKSPEVRKGCQAALASCKCPMLTLTRINRHRHTTGAEVVINGKLPRELLEHIRPIKFQDGHFIRYAVSPAERDRMLGANDRIDKLIGSAPSVESISRRMPTVKASKPAGALRANKPAAPTYSANDTAAATGDLGAAISQSA